MKKLLCLLVASAWLFFANAQESKWTASNYSDFLNSCVVEANKGMGIDTARSYCYCIMMKIEKQYPDPADLVNIDMESESLKNDVIACLVKPRWPQEYRTNFLNSCIESAGASFSKPVATSYCECMMYKLEILYPNTKDADNITAADFEKPEWKRLIRSCLPEKSN